MDRAEFIPDEIDVPDELVQVDLAGDSRVVIKRYLGRMERKERTVIEEAGGFEDDGPYTAA